MKKVILAYSGGLDTTCCVHWLKNQGFNVICFSADLGSEFSPRDLKQKAAASGASKIYIRDLKREFADEYILPALKAGAIYQKKYVLSTALGRPLIAKYLVELARKEKARFLAHGCTAKGNDQVRLEVSAHILNPRLKIIAPLRQWELKSREEEIQYAKKYKLPLTVTKEKPYSIDKNIWGVSVEGGVLEDLSQEPPLNSYYFVKSLRAAKSKETQVEIEFREGKPVKLNGRKMDLVSLIERLNRIGAECGVGRTDLIEDRTIGIKSREIYEAPAAWILHTAHGELENLTLDKETLFFNELAGLKYAQLIYQGLAFTQFKKSLDTLAGSIQKRVSGKIRMKLYKGNIIITRRYSPHSVYRKEIATYGKGDKFDRNLAKGFIELWAMPYV